MTLEFLRNFSTIFNQNDIEQSSAILKSGMTLDAWLSKRRRTQNEKEIQPTEPVEEPTKATLDEEVSLQTPRPEAPSEGKEEESTMEVDTSVSIEPDNAVVEDDNAGGLDGSVTEETPNEENPLGDSEEAILTSATEKMEEGDEQYKNELAESQMDNIFNWIKIQIIIFYDKTCFNKHI